MSETLAVRPIGVIHTPHKEARGTPIQPKFAEGIEGTVEVDSQYVEGLADLDGFERIWLVYWFDRSPGMRLRVKPFMDDAERGLFATRAPCRPNPIGFSCVRLLKIDGNVLHVADVDMLDGTPLLDIKPYIARFDTWDVDRSGWQDGVEARATRADRRFGK